MDDARAVVGCLCETCDCPVQVRLHPGTDEEALFCVTCDIFVHVDNVIDPWCTETRLALDGTHPQTCGEVRGHAGPHSWTCDHPEPDGDGRCCLDAEDPHAEGHEYLEPLNVEPRCKSLVRTWPHGFNFRCQRGVGHEGPHVAEVKYGLNGIIDGYVATWVLADPFVERVPDQDGVRYVLADEAPVTCGRCGSARVARGDVDVGVTSWRCDRCGEDQYDVLCEEDDHGTLVKIEAPLETRE